MAKTLSDLVTVGALRMPKGAVLAPRLVKTPARVKSASLPPHVAKAGHPAANLGRHLHPKGGLK